MKDQVIQQLLENVQNIDDFTTDKLPEVVLQILKYEKIVVIAAIGLTLALLSVAAYIGYQSWKYPTLDKDGLRTIGSTFGVFIPCAASSFILIQLCASISTLIKLYVAPKLFLIQFITSLTS